MRFCGGGLLLLSSEPSEELEEESFCRSSSEVSDDISDQLVISIVVGAESLGFGISGSDDDADATSSCARLTRTGLPLPP
jgi:hypothetical protein